MTAVAAKTPVSLIRWANLWWAGAAIAVMVLAIEIGDF